MRKKVLSLLLCMSLSAGLFVGCGSPQKEQSGEDVQKESSSVDAADSEEDRTGIGKHREDNPFCG